LDVSALPAPTRLALTDPSLIALHDPACRFPRPAFPLRLRPEIEIWLCKNACKGWILVMTEDRRYNHIGDFWYCREEFWIDFADPDDAFWFRITWT
jgi:hypothetical protein